MHPDRIKKDPFSWKQVHFDPQSRFSRITFSLRKQLFFFFVSLVVHVYSTSIQVAPPTPGQKCGVIKPNQSKVRQIELKCCYLIVHLVCKVTFCRKPYLNWAISSRDTSSRRLAKTIRNKDYCFVLWLYLKNNFSNFWLILLDHITNDQLQYWQ